MRLKRIWFVVLFLALNSILLFAAGSAQAVNLVTETFTGATAPYANWPISGDAAFITATQADATSGTVVQLTPATNTKAGTLVYDKAFSSVLGATITFDYLMGGGTGADGFSVFLVDGATTSVTAGKSGGTLGYGTNYTSINGVPNAYAAVGFDVYGNCIVEFGNSAGTGANNGTRTQNNVCIGGSGNLLAGYRYLTGATNANIGHATIWRRAEVTVKRGDGTNGCVNGGVCLSVRFSTNNGGAWTSVHTDYRVDNATSQATIPDTFKIGFSGSTGGSNNKHYIDNVQIDLTGAQLDVLKAGTGTGTVTSTSVPTQTTQFNCGATCSVAYPAATAITLTATPSASSSFTSWSGGTGSASCTGTGTCAVTLNANSSVTANFAINTYTVTYNGNTNTGGTAPTDGSSPYNYNTSVTVLGNTGSLVKTGYTFAGWNTAANGSGTSYSAGNTFNIAANTTLYAQWTINTYTVTYNGNGNTGGTAPTDGSSPYNYNTSVTVLGNTGSLVKTGYTFAGWNTAANGSGTSYAPAATFTIAANTTLYAQWTINTYTVTYNGNGNTGGTAPTDGSSPYNYNSTVTVLGNTGSLVKTGYTFANWNTAANGSGTSYAPAATFAIAANTTLYAQWTIMGGSIQGTAINVEPAVVSTFAGAAGASGSTDGTGTAARFNLPTGITTDGTNLYQIEYNNHTIRKIVISTGVVTTIAGTAGASGSIDGTGAAARFNSPQGITTDGANLYVGDFGNQTIRKIVISTGVVTTIAGTAGITGSIDGTGTAARFNGPTGITTDGTNLYVVEFWIHTIRKIVISTGEVTTIAGTAGASGSTDGTGTAARFNRPYGITTDGTNLYVGDFSNNTIRKIVISTGVVTTIAGTAGLTGSTDATGTAARFNAPGAITTDGTNLYVLEQGNHTIRKIVISTGVVTTIAGTAGITGSIDGTGTAARFYDPHGITTDGTNLYVGDYGNHTIRKIEKGFVVTPSAGAGGTISPATAQTTNSGSTMAFTVTPNAGYSISSTGGTCGGALVGTTYTTNAITTNCTVSATFTINTYTMTYDGNTNTGGTAPTDGSSPYNYNSTVTVLGNTGSLVKTGYTFAGWNTAANGSGTAYAATNTFAIAANTTLYAQWTSTVTYSGNGNTGGAAPTDGSSYLPGATVTVLGNTGSLVKTGYTFANWNTAANGSGTSYAPTATFANTGDTTLYAQWTINTYTVTYNGNGNTGGTAPTDGSSPYNYNSTVTVLGNTGSLVKTGYAFANWNTAANGSGTSYAPAATFAIAANTTLYAQWTINTYTVTTTATNGTITSTNNPTVNHGSTTTVTGSANANYYFTGVSGCGGTAQTNTNQATTTFSYTTAAITSACTVTATFAIKTYTVTTTATNGTITSTNNPTVNHGLTTTVTGTANAKYYISSVSGCGGIAQNNTNQATTNFSYTTGAITGTCTVTATFSHISYITTTAGASAMLQNGSAVIVDAGVIVDTDAGNFAGGKVSITSGFAAGDTLAWDTAVTTALGINGSYNSTTGILTFTGTTTPANWQAIFRTVTIRTTSASTTARTVAFTIGSAIPYSGNGHFYEYISTTDTWTAGKAAAAARTLFGLQGYLATITSSGENDFVQQKLGADAWIGASDEFSQINTATGAATYADQAAAEGHWYWVTGPSGEKGTNFSNNNYPTTVVVTYANWNTLEPNNSGSSEHYGEIYSIAPGTGKWNDMPNSSSLGYVVEYGGMAGDPVVTLTASKTVNNTASYTVTANQTGTTGGTATITSNTGGINCTWNGTAQGGTCTSGAISSGASVTLTAALPADTTIAWGAGCNVTTATTCTISSLTANRTINATYTYSPPSDPTPEPTPAPTPQPAPTPAPQPVIIPGYDPQISYTGGGWQSRTMPGSYSGSLTEIENMGGVFSSVSMSFEGTTISLRSMTSPRGGTAKVYIDGAYITTINLHSTSTAFDVEVFSRTLSSGAHTLRIVPEPLLPGRRINIDRFIITR